MTATNILAARAQDKVDNLFAVGGPGFAAMLSRRGSAEPQSPTAAPSPREPEDGFPGSPVSVRAAFPGKPKVSTIVSTRTLGALGPLIYAV
jgi:hypothetical protein